MTEKASDGRGPAQRARASARRVCSECQKVVPLGEDGLLVVRKLWVTTGKGPKTIRSRTVNYQCHECAEKDPVWNQAPYADAPGNV